MKIQSKLIAILALVSLSQVCLAAEPAEKTPEMKMDQPMKMGQPMAKMDESKMMEHLKMRQDQILKMHDLSNKILAETDYNLFMQKQIIKSVKTNQYKPGKWSVSIVPEYQLIIIDKKTRKGTYAKLTDDIFHFLSDEFLNYRLEWAENHRVNISVQAIDYLKAIKESKSVESATKEAMIHRDKLKGVTENSNPIILTFTLNDRIRIN